MYTVNTEERMTREVRGLKPEFYKQQLGYTVGLHSSCRDARGPEAGSVRSSGARQLLPAGTELRYGQRGGAGSGGAGWGQKAVLGTLGTRG